MTVAYLGIALLAGAALTGLGRRRLGRGARGPLLPALVLAVVLVDLRTAEETALADYAAGQEVHTLPAVDLLTVRYVVAAASPLSGTADPRQLDPRLKEVYRDERVVVLEDPAALPRAWVVHEAREVEPGRALELLASGAVDPRRTALLDEPPPTVGRPADGAASTASVAEYRADRIALEVSAAAPGLLVLSEVYYPAWKAYVDGRPAPLYVADHALRAVPVPAGDHAVELRYESPALQIGIVISLVTSALVVRLALAGCVRRGGRDQGRAGWWR